MAYWQFWVLVLYGAVIVWRLGQIYYALYDIKGRLSSIDVWLSWIERAERERNQ